MEYDDLYYEKVNRMTKSELLGEVKTLVKKVNSSIITYETTTKKRMLDIIGDERDKSTERNRQQDVAFAYRRLAQQMDTEIGFTKKGKVGVKQTETLNQLRKKAMILHNFMNMKTRTQRGYMKAKQESFDALKEILKKQKGFDVSKVPQNFNSEFFSKFFNSFSGFYDNEDTRLYTHTKGYREIREHIINLIADRPDMDTQDIINALKSRYDIENKIKMGESLNNNDVEFLRLMGKAKKGRFPEYEW